MQCCVTVDGGNACDVDDGVGDNGGGGIDDGVDDNAGVGDDGAV